MTTTFLPQTATKVFQSSEGRRRAFCASYVLVHAVVALTLQAKAGQTPDLKGDAPASPCGGRGSTVTSGPAEGCLLRCSVVRTFQLSVVTSHRRHGLESTKQLDCLTGKCEKLLVSVDV